MKLIAEIGWNHMGDMDLLARMVRAAKDAGATHAKFQTWNEKNLKQGPWDQDGRRQIYIKAQLSVEQFAQVKKLCDDTGILFMTSIFNSQDAEPMAKINAAEIKIPSHEIANRKLIDNAARLFKKVYLSTGASTEAEVDQAIQIVRGHGTELVLMHCVSTYPCTDENVNLPRLQALKQKHDRIGFSDHTSDIFASLFALGMGIEAIEKHFTIDNELPGRDNKFAILPAALKELAQAIGRFEKMNRSHGFNYQQGEAETVNVYRGRWAPADYKELH